MGKFLEVLKRVGISTASSPLQPCPASACVVLQVRLASRVGKGRMQVVRAAARSPLVAGIGLGAFGALEVRTHHLDQAAFGGMRALTMACCRRLVRGARGRADLPRWSNIGTVARRVHQNIGWTSMLDRQLFSETLRRLHHKAATSTTCARNPSRRSARMALVWNKWWRVE